MPKARHGLQTRVIKVLHPTFKDIVVFEAHVKIINLRLDLVKSIKSIKIEWDLKGITS
jgi:hypothetical protein